MKKKIESDEIDLIEVIINIWNKKLKIAAITLVFIVLSTTLSFVSKPPLVAKTEILPITIFEENLYLSYNSLITPQDEMTTFQYEKNKNVFKKKIESKKLLEIIF